MTNSREIIISPNDIATTSEAADFIQTVLGTPEIAKATRHFLTVKLANEHTRASYKKSAVDFLGHVSDRHIWRYVQPSEEEKEQAQEELL